MSSLRPGEGLDPSKGEDLGGLIQGAMILERWNELRERNEVTVGEVLMLAIAFSAYDRDHPIADGAEDPLREVRRELGAVMEFIDPM